MDIVLLISLPLFLGILAFWIVGAHCHQGPAHKVYDPPAEHKPADSHKKLSS